VEVEDEIKLAHIAKVAVQDLHIVMHKLQGDQLIVASINAHDKVEAGISLVHHLPPNQATYNLCNTTSTLFEKALCNAFLPILM
jgi:hypothetical protein